MHTDTKCVHSGGGSDTITGGVNTPVFPSSAHEYLDAEFEPEQPSPLLVPPPLPPPPP